MTDHRAAPSAPSGSGRNRSETGGRTIGAGMATQTGRTGPSIDFTGMEPRAEQAAAFLRSMANKHRLMILCALSEREHSAGELAERIGLRQPNTSQHLFKLRAEGLVETRRDAQTIYYRLASDDVRRIIDCLYQRFCGA